MMKRVSITMMLLLAMLPAVASDFVQNAVHYRTLTDSTVMVTNYESSDKDGSAVYIPMESPAMRTMAATGYSVSIPMTVTDSSKTYTVVAIGDNAFLNLNKMSAITLPASISSVGKSAFSGCSGLLSITCSTSVPPTAYANSFTSVDKSACTLYINMHTRSLYAAATGWSDFQQMVETGYKISYVVDGVVYATDSLSPGQIITPAAAPTKEGYTFSGWSEIPATMPAKDVEVIGSFAINTYAVVYKVDGEIYKTDSVKYGAAINSAAAPTKEGYTFSGWSDIPTTMPAKDVEVTGSFAINTYAVVYKVDGEIYKTESVQYGATITPATAPTKEGYTFSGWSEIPATMPAKDVEVTGSFAINTYAVVYKVDGEIYKTDSVKYGAAITPAAAPTKEGYTFSGWSEIPTTMPAKDVEVTGSFAINTYAVDLTVGEGGTATVTNSNPTYGSSDTLTVTPNAGYQIASVVVNEVDVTASLVDGSYTITNISADVKISVTFSIINGLERIATEADAATTVDLSGRKVQNPRKGEILIQNGKKIVKR